MFDIFCKNLTTIESFEILDLLKNKILIFSVCQKGLSGKVNNLIEKWFIQINGPFEWCVAFEAFFQALTPRPGLANVYLLCILCGKITKIFV